MQIRTITKMGFSGSSYSTTVPKELVEEKIPEVFEDGNQGRVFWKEDSKGRLIVDFDVVEKKD